MGLVGGSKRRRPVLRRRAAHGHRRPEGVEGVSTRPRVGVGATCPSTVRSLPSGGPGRPSSREGAVHDPGASLHPHRVRLGKKPIFRRCDRSDATLTTCPRRGSGRVLPTPPAEPAPSLPPGRPPRPTPPGPHPPRFRRGPSPTNTTVPRGLQDRTRRTDVLSARSAQETGGTRCRSKRWPGQCHDGRATPAIRTSATSVTSVTDHGRFSRERPLVQAAHLWWRGPIGQDVGAFVGAFRLWRWVRRTRVRCDSRSTSRGVA